MDTYSRWIGVPVALLVCGAVILAAFFLNVFLGLLALIFVGSVAEIWAAHTYAQKPPGRNYHQPPQ